MGERTVVFYECQDIADERPFDRLLAFSDINQLDDADWRVYDPVTDTELAVIVDQVGDQRRPTAFRFLRIRPDAPFVLSRARELSPVEVEEDENITEFTHAVIWPDNFLGVLASRDAPAPKRLSHYVRAASDEWTYIVNLFHPDVLERLHELRRGGLRGVKLKVRRSVIAQLEADANRRGLGQLFAAANATDVETIGIEVSVGRRRAARLSDELADDAEELARVSDMLESMVVKGRDDHGEIKSINMKKERVSAVIELDAGADNRAIYRRIIRARRLAEEDIAGDLDRSARGS